MNLDLACRFLNFVMEGVCGPAGLCGLPNGNNQDVDLSAVFVGVIDVVTDIFIS